MNQANDEVWRLAKRIGEAAAQGELPQTQGQPTSTKVQPFEPINTFYKECIVAPMLVRSARMPQWNSPASVVFGLPELIWERCAEESSNCMKVETRAGLGTPSLPMGHLRHLNIGSHANESSPGGVS